MSQELDNKIRRLRAELTQVVREGNDEEGTLLRRLLAELERLENQRMALRGMRHPDIRGGSRVGLAV
ncbi:hypothetical protein TFLX_01652 [Thermoflexales bacterium]|nr:hypothetical protein TFLX_01652 [Thermoflexales bacterium]